MTLEPIISGIAFGLILAVMIGPVFFALIQTSLHEGFKAGRYLAAGVLLSDALYILVAYTVASQLDLTGKYKIATGMIGGSMLICFGIYYFMHKIKQREIDDEKKTVHAKFLLKGFLLNAFNPAVLLFWLGVVSHLKLKEYERQDEYIFFGTTLLTVFSTDMLKSYVAHSISHFLKPNILLLINRMVGIALILFGAHTMYKAFS